MQGEEKGVVSKISGIRERRRKKVVIMKLCAYEDLSRDIRLEHIKSSEKWIGRHASRQTK